MDVFGLRDYLIENYHEYISGFIKIKDEHIREKVDEEMKGGLLWPEPLLQLNPSFKLGESIDELVDAGILHDECRQLFRKDKKEGNLHGQSLRLHKHQADAIKIARDGHNYVLTTGTGSGKSLAYIIPIVDYVLRKGSGQGIQAIVIYPMNALANSQEGELKKFLSTGYPNGKGPITFARYTGQERRERKEEIINNPPDILLTNYVMLELLLTRPEERPLINTAKGLRFLVLDELHSYRGRQGADVAMLIRRAREAFAATELQCVGTSATLAGPGTYEEQQTEVARVASLLFGATVSRDHIIGETLRRSTPNKDLSDSKYVEELRNCLAEENWKPSNTYEEFIKNPLSIWIESMFGVTEDNNTGQLVRSEALSISGEHGAAKKLSNLTETREDRCERAIKEQLLASYKYAKDPETERPIFAFRLHQFVGRGDTTYASLEAEADRYLTMHGQQFVPGDRDRYLLPLVFCRECGQEYYSVRKAVMGPG